jgi:hypothetical protein
MAKGDTWYRSSILSLSSVKLWPQTGFFNIAILCQGRIFYVFESYGGMFMIGSEARGEELRGWLVPPPSITALALVLAPFLLLAQ